MDSLGVASYSGEDMVCQGWLQFGLEVNMIARNRYVVKRDTGCWEWQGAKTRGGYGRCKYKGQAWMAHRLSYTLSKGEIPVGMLLLHSCDNPCCINPEHLSVGTQKDNMDDCKAKGRLGPRGRKLNSRPKESATEQRVRKVIAAYNRGWSPKKIAEYFKLSAYWVRKVIQVELFNSQ